MVGGTGTHMCCNTRVQPARVMVVAHEGLVLDHVSGVVHSRADLASDLDLLECHNHGPDGAFSHVALGKQVPKLHDTSWVLLLKLWKEETEGFYKLLPANKADYLCQSWQSCPIESDEYVCGGCAAM